MAATPGSDNTAESLKKRALIRLGIAGAITAAALLGLWWLDRSAKTTPERKPAAPAPIVTAPQPAPPPEPLAPEVSPEPPVPEPIVAQPPAPAAEPAAKPALPPPPPRVGALPPAPVEAAARPTPARTPTPVPTRTPSAPPPAQGRGFVVQLGVFSDPDNAKQLVDRLTKLGIRAWSETRVQVGPFHTRAEAEKAQAELRRLGLNAVISPQGATR